MINIDLDLINKNKVASIKEGINFNGGISLLLTEFSFLVSFFAIELYHKNLTLQQIEKRINQAVNLGFNSAQVAILEFNRGTPGEK